MIASATTTRLANLVASFARRAPSRSGSPSTRLSGLADYLDEVAKLPIREFITRAMQVTLEDRCARHDALKERLANDPSYTAYWRRAADRYMDAFHHSAGRPAFYLPVEFQSRGSLDAAFGKVQRFVGGFADLIAWWPAIVSETRRGRVLFS
jgi:hypothetical protein